MMNSTMMSKKDLRIKAEKEKKKKQRAEKKLHREERKQMNALIELDQGLANVDEVADEQAR